MASAQICRSSLFAAAFSGRRNSWPSCNAHSCGTTVPGGLVQHVFSPPARIKSLHTTALWWPRHCAKNALHYVVHHIRPRSAPPGRSAPKKVATISHSSSTTPPSRRPSTQTCSATRVPKATPCCGRGRARTASEARSVKPRPVNPGGASLVSKAGKTKGAARACRGAGLSFRIAQWA